MAQKSVKSGDIDGNLQTYYALIDGTYKYSVEVLTFLELCR